MLWMLATYDTRTIQIIQNFGDMKDTNGLCNRLLMVYFPEGSAFNIENWCGGCWWLKHSWEAKQIFLLIESEAE